MKQIIILSLCLLTLEGCYYGVNKTTSHIGKLNTECVSIGAMDSIIKEYNISAIKNPVYVDALNDFSNQPFDCDLIYFSDSPMELIGVANDHYSVRYVFNDSISNRVMDNYSQELRTSEKNRILNRVQELLMNYQCEAGKVKSMNEIKERKNRGTNKQLAESLPLVRE